MKDVGSERTRAISVTVPDESTAVAKAVEWDGLKRDTDPLKKMSRTNTTNRRAVDVMEAGTKIPRLDDIVTGLGAEDGPKELDLTETLCSDTSKLEGIRKEATEKAGILIGKSDEMVTKKRKATRLGNDDNKKKVVKGTWWLMEMLTAII